MFYTKTMQISKPFLLLQSRPEAAASDDEYQAFLKFGGLAPEQLVRVRLERGEFMEIDLDEYSGVIMGGGPANFAYDEDEKSADQKQFEAYIVPLLRRIIAQDKPFLGACLGVGALTTALGEKPSFDYGEPVGAVDIRLTEAAAADPLLADLPPSFRGFVGHKEGMAAAPAGSVALATSDTCVQMFRVGKHVYATQFHPELDAEGLALRIGVYKNAGYFAPDEAEHLAAAGRRETITEPVKILRRFVELYADIPKHAIMI